MKQPLLPKEAQFISSVTLAAGCLSIRLIPEQIVRADEQAYVITVRESRDAEASLKAVESLRVGNVYVYVFLREGRLVIAGEHEDEIEIEAKEFAGEAAELSTAELRETLEFWHKLYENAHEYGAKVQLRLRRVQELVTEQERRISVKAAGHAPESAASVLYSQQVAFLQRMLRASEGHDG
jgi:hypothetical protein